MSMYIVFMLYDHFSWKCDSLKSETCGSEYSMLQMPSSCIRTGHKFLLSGYKFEVQLDVIANR